MTRVSFVFATTLGSLTLALTTPAPAEATRPLVRPPSSIKISRLNMPVTLQEAMSRKVNGLDLEETKARDSVMKQARDYVELRSGAWDQARIRAWLDACQKKAPESEASPFCQTEVDRLSPLDRVVRFPSEVKAQRHEIADLLKDGKFSKIAGKNYQDVMQALGSIGDAETISPIAVKASQNKECLPSAVTSALGYKIEELFPQTENVELTKALYRKSVTCGEDYPAAQAAFRLGLILVWQNQCGEVDALMKKVESIPDASQFHARAKFWRYHCAGVANDEKSRGEMRESLVTTHPMSFQNLAVNGGNLTIMSRVVHDDRPNVMLRSIVRPDLNSVLRAAEALDRAGDAPLAAEMIDRHAQAIGEIEPEVRLYVAVFLDRIGQTLTKFKILSSLFQDSPRLVNTATMQMMFPLVYADLVRAKAKDIDPLLILSLMRQESAFNPEARSSVGARGLMQVMPATARSIASVKANRLFDPATNVGVGTKYFMKRLQQYGGDVELTLAAYNAGFARVDQWLKRYPTQNKLLFLDFIPFKETREYVSSILRNYYWYVRLYSPTDAKVAIDTGKVQPSDLKVQAIMSANAGLVAAQSKTDGR